MKDQYVLLGIIFAPLLTFFGIKYANSGDINHSTAGDLWKASEEIREELRREVGILRKRVKELEECCEKHRAKVR